MSPIDLPAIVEEPARLPLQKPSIAPPQDDPQEGIVDDELAGARTPRQADGWNPSG